MSIMMDRWVIMNHDHNGGTLKQRRWLSIGAG